MLSLHRRYQISGNNIMRAKYTNGSYIGAEVLCSIDVEQVRNAIVVASNDGIPFRGKPRDMADDVLAHILNKFSSKMGFIPVIYESCGGIDKYRNYTTDVVFQAVCPFSY